MTAAKKVRPPNGDNPERRLMTADRLEWREDGKQPFSLTARKFRPQDGPELWVATHCGVYDGDDALLAKHRDMLEAHGDAALVVRFSVSIADWEARTARIRRRAA